MTETPIYDQVCRERHWQDHRTPLPLGQVRATRSPVPETVKRRPRQARKGRR